ncbi:hypothetical protein KJ815_00895, partial [bacterium]|nr:hypothetical protein [bacterium]
MRSLFFVVLLPALSYGAVINVFPPSGIQSAVHQASPHDTILVHDGEYTETVVLYGKDLVIASLYLMDGDISHVSATIICPDSLHPDTGSCLVYAYGETLAGALVGVTLRNGRGTYWNYAG